MGIEGSARIRDGAEYGHGGMHGGDFESMICRGSAVLRATEAALKHPGGVRDPFVERGVSMTPLATLVRHGREIVESACREATEGQVGVRTAQAIAGSVTEEITRGVIVTGTVLGVGSALATGGAALLVGGAGVVGYLVLPRLVRFGAEALIDSLDRGAGRLGVKLRELATRTSGA